MFFVNAIDRRRRRCRHRHFFSSIFNDMIWLKWTVKSSVVQSSSLEKHYIVKSSLPIEHQLMRRTNRSNFNAWISSSLTSLISGSFEKISWASVQLHCQRYINEQKVNLQTPIGNSRSSDALASNMENLSVDSTTLIATKGETGQTVYTSKPCVLFCDLTLHPGESKTCR